MPNAGYSPNKPFTEDNEENKGITATRLPDKGAFPTHHPKGDLSRVCVLLKPFRPSFPLLSSVQFNFCFWVQSAFGTS
jgi:hypothetical protein